MIVPKVLIAILFMLAVSRGQIVDSPLTASLKYQGQKGQTCCDDNTITVYGSASVQVPADTATLSVQVTVSANTVNAVILLLSAKVKQVIGILNSNGLDSSKYQTSSLNVYPNNSYADGVVKVLGQIATQSFTINIPIIKSNTALLGKLIDLFAAVDGIILNGVSFDVADKTDGLANARGKAFANAQRKASDYTALLKLSLGQLVQIIDSYNSAPSVFKAQQSVTAKMGFMNSIAPSTQTTVNPGAITISYNVNAIYNYN